jgi:hypothetical protein
MISFNRFLQVRIFMMKKVNRITAVSIFRDSSLLLPLLFGQEVTGANPGATGGGHQAKNI